MCFIWWADLIEIVWYLKQFSDAYEMLWKLVSHLQGQLSFLINLSNIWINTYVFSRWFLLNSQHSMNLCVIPSKASCLAIDIFFDEEAKRKFLLICLDMSPLKFCLYQWGTLKFYCKICNTIGNNGNFSFVYFSQFYKIHLVKVWFHSC